MIEEEMFKTNHGFDEYSIKAFIITLTNNNVSVVATRKLLFSMKKYNCRIQSFIMNATTPDTIYYDLKSTFSEDYVKKLYNPTNTYANQDLRWNWPIHPSQDGIDLSTGLYKKWYGEKDWTVKAACTISHMRLWQHCIDINEPIMILEHDAIFQRQFNLKHIAKCGEKDENGKYITPLQLDAAVSHSGGVRKPIGQWDGGIVGLNDPVGATRKWKVFFHKTAAFLGLQPTPYVDDPGDPAYPAGLAGNSAYIIKPWAAKKLLKKVEEVGLWPNDALMCRQFFPWIQVFFPFFTRVQQITSTTT
jgi:GR25 family glycosyltransferase involved in LPS biosynthesis